MARRNNFNEICTRNTATEMAQEHALMLEYVRILLLFAALPAGRRAARYDDDDVVLSFLPFVLFCSALRPSSNALRCARKEPAHDAADRDG